MFRKHITFLIVPIAAAPLFSLCLKRCLFKAPPPDKAQSAMIGQLAHSVVIGQVLPVCVVNVGLCSFFTWLCYGACQFSH